MRYDKCPKCKATLPAHKGHTEAFTGLTPKEQSNSIKMMTINLKKAVRRGPGTPDILWVINYLSKR